MARVKTINQGDGSLHGYSFVCPGCRCIHTVPVAGAVAWGFNGNLDLPSFTPSLKVTGVNWTVGSDGHFSEVEFNGVCHSWITDGRIKFFDDSTHEHKGQTLDMAEIAAGGVLNG